MKNSKTMLTLVAIAASLISVHAQDKDNSKQNYVYLTGTRFTYPLVEKWISAYTRENPDTKVRLLKKGENTDSANVTIISHKLDNTQLKESNLYIQVAEYALLPIANQANPFAQKVVKDGIEEKQLKELFIKGEDESFLSQEELAKLHQKNHFTVYTRANAACASISFADHFGNTWESIKGKGISGDDKYLLSAVLKDTNGLSYNNLGYLYDLQTRKPIKGIAILPIDINQNGKLDQEEKIYENLDQVIAYLENNPDEKGIPTAYVNFVFDKNKNNDALQPFLNWVLTEGQKYNHEFGFFTYGPKILAKQVKTIQQAVN